MTQQFGTEQVPINDDLVNLTEEQMMDFLNQTLFTDSQVIEEADAMPASPTVIAEADFKPRAHGVKRESHSHRSERGKSPAL